MNFAKLDKACSAIMILITITLKSNVHEYQIVCEHGKPVKILLHKVKWYLIDQMGNRAPLWWIDRCL